MKELYSQPILIVSLFKVNDDLMAKPDKYSSEWRCGSIWCTPNGHHDDGSCPRDTSCYSDPGAIEGSDWGYSAVN